MGERCAYLPRAKFIGIIVIRKYVDVYSIHSLWLCKFAFDINIKRGINIPGDRNALLALPVKTLLYWSISVHYGSLKFHIFEFFFFLGSILILMYFCFCNDWFFQCILYPLLGYDATSLWKWISVWLDEILVLCKDVFFNKSIVSHCYKDTTY